MYQVLVAEDEMWIRRAIMEMVDRAGFQTVAEASNGEEAWNQIQEVWPTIVITDIMMPQKDGLWLIEQISEHKLPIVCIVVSGYDNFQYAQQAIRFGISEYLLKPVKQEELSKALERSISRLEHFKDLHSFLLKIQDFIQQMPNLDPADLKRKYAHLIQLILRLKVTNPGARMSLLRVFSEKMNTLVEGIYPEHERQSLEKDDQDYVDSHFQRLLDQWFMHYGNFSVSNQKLVIRNVCDYIKNHYNEDFMLTDMAEMSLMSVSYFSTIFKQHTGQTLINYINQIRIEKAKELLLDPALKIYEVSEAVGYTTLQYFNRVFKSQVGMTPNEYRKKLGI
jgi:two-component system response regulator YesN